MVIIGLMLKIDYMFKVWGVFKDVEGFYSLVSDNIMIIEFVVIYLMKFCIVLKKGYFFKYFFFVEENIKLWNEVVRMR